MKNKILFVLTYYIGGGIEQTFKTLARCINEKFENISVYLYVINGVNNKDEIPQNVMYIATFSKLFRIFRGNRDAIVVNYSGDWKSSLLASIISKEYISWIHTNPDTMYTAKTANINFCLLRKSRKVVCVCNEQKDMLRDKYKFYNELLTIYNCVDENKIKELSCEEISFKHDYILMVARLDLDSKDFYTLLNAYSKLPKEYIQKYKLVLLGNGNGEHIIKNWIDEMGLRESVHMPGYEKNPYKWMNRAEIALLISKTEGFNVSVIETMACNTPMIISEYHTGAKEVADGGKNCEIVPVGDVEGLKNKLKELLDNSAKRDELVQNANEYLSNFSYRKYCENIYALFKSFCRMK